MCDRSKERERARVRTRTHARKHLNCIASSECKCVYGKHRNSE